MLLEAQRRGYEIHYMEMHNLSLRGGVASARTRLLTVEQNPENWYQFGSEQVIPLADLNVVLMRKIRHSIPSSSMRPTFWSALKSWVR